MPAPERILLASTREIKIYAIRSDKKVEFLAYAKDGGNDASGNPVNYPDGEPFKGIRDWLVRQDRARRADFWTAESNGMLQLIVAIDSDGSGWDSIPGLYTYLQGGVTIEPQPELRIVP